MRVLNCWARLWPDALLYKALDLSNRLAVPSFGFPAFACGPAWLWLCCQMCLACTKVFARVVSATFASFKLSMPTCRGKCVHQPVRV